MTILSFSHKGPNLMHGHNISCSTKRKYISLRTPTLEPIEKINTVIEQNPDIQSEYNPVVDEEITNVVFSIAGHRDISTKELPIIELPPLPQINDPSFEMILSAKLELCSQNLDFSSPDKQIQMKDQKKRTLNEFIMFFDRIDQKEALKFNPIYQRAFFRMLNKNIIRDDPKFPGSLETLNYTFSVVEPSWPHLMLCYQLLLRFITLFQDAEFVNLSFIRKIIFLMQLPDSNERAQLASLVKTYFTLHPESQSWILNEVKNSLINLNSNQLSPFALQPLLLVLYHILSKRNPELEKEIRKVFIECSLPLLGYPYINQQYIQLKNYFMTAIKVYNDLTIPLMKEIQKKWPRQNGIKRQLMLDLLISVAEVMNRSDFSRIASSFFAFLNNELLTDHVKIIEKVFQIFIQEEYRSWISVNSTPAIKEMYQNVNYIRLHHWNPNIQQKSEQVLKKMQELNPSEIAKFRTGLTKKRSFNVNLESLDKRSAYSSWVEILRSTDAQDLDLTKSTITEYFKKARMDREIRFIPIDFKPGSKKSEIPVTNSLKKDLFSINGNISLQPLKRIGSKRANLQTHSFDKFAIPTIKG